MFRRFNNRFSLLTASAPKKLLRGGASSFFPSREFSSDYMNRHLGPRENEVDEMLKKVGYENLDKMMMDIVPSGILRPKPLKHFPAMNEHEALASLRNLMGRNKVLKSMIGQGFYEALTPSVILRNILESPGWYTPYTPYQAELSQGRLEALLNWQTMIASLVSMEYANASLLDEATAAGECLFLAYNHHKKKRGKIFVDQNCFTASIEMIKTRAAVMKVEVVIGDAETASVAEEKDVCAIIVQTPNAKGALHDYTNLFAKAKANGTLTCCGADLMACTLVKSPGEMGADVVFGNSQRFGIPLGYGGPHAAFMAVKDEYKRIMPGRLIGISRDAQGGKCYRMTLQTREQHIKREKATSNICTAQALLANMAGMYGVWHGPEGLKNIATRINSFTGALAAGFGASGHTVINSTFFDTITVKLGNGLNAQKYSADCTARGINIWIQDEEHISISVDEATTEEHLSILLECAGAQRPSIKNLQEMGGQLPEPMKRASAFMQHQVFNTHRSETEMMRYIYGLQRKDYGLNVGMIPLGSCTMKLNSSASMLPMSWSEIGNIHPFVPEDQARGYAAMFVGLENKLCDATGFAACSLQPNSGSNGEYTGLRCIRAYHESKGDGGRDICVIPKSAHGTNPASAVVSGYKILEIKCTVDGKIDMKDLQEKCQANAKQIACCMVTYPSTYGVFDQDILEVTKTIHDVGGQVYIDGANLNAMLGYTGPYFVGGDVCHINMHKTFSIPHGGGGPGMGPICVREHLAPFLPNSTAGPSVGGSNAFGQVSQGHHGSASILPISYITMLMSGSQGLKEYSQIAVLNANYLRKRLEGHYDVLFKGETGCCAHEFIIDMRPFKKSCKLEAEDVAKRLMDYNFHAPTLAFPVAGTLMVEPTESEPLSEIDRLADALISIRQEISEIEKGTWPMDNNPLKNAPHTCKAVLDDNWNRPYTRERAGYPVPALKDTKFWPTVGRIDGVYGDRNLVVTLPE